MKTSIRLVLAQTNDFTKMYKGLNIANKVEVLNFFGVIFSLLLVPKSGKPHHDQILLILIRDLYLVEMIMMIAYDFDSNSVLNIAKRDNISILK